MTALSVSASMMHQPDEDVLLFRSPQKKKDGKKKGEELLNSEKKKLYLCINTDV